MSKKNVLFALPIAMLLACSEGNSSSPMELQTLTSSEFVGTSSSNENPGLTFKSSDSQSNSLTSSSSDALLSVPSTLPDSVLEEMEKEIRIERLNKQIDKLQSANECSTIECITEEEISYCKTRFCLLHPEIWQGCEE